MGLYLDFHRSTTEFGGHYGQTDYNGTQGQKLNGQKSIANDRGLIPKNLQKQPKPTVEAVK
jgi:hypothetical protein